MEIPFMQLAISQAQMAFAQGEVPVGAVVVKDGAVIGAAYNRREQSKRAIAHGEIEAIEQACIALGSWRLTGCDLYVTLEPCMMCMGAILQARIANLYFGAYAKSDNTFGVAFDTIEVAKQYPITVYGGIMEQPCEQLLQQFFAAKRR